MHGPEDVAGPEPGASAELFERIVESSTDFAIFTITPDGVATSWNIGAQRVFGFAAEEMVGRSGDVIFTPADRAAGAPQAERDVAARCGRAEDERWHLRRDGSLFWATGVLTPLRNPGQGFLKIVRDRTAQHRASEALRESEERFRLLAVSIPQLVFRTRSDGSRTWGSPQWVDFTGLGLPDSLGLGWLDAIHPDDRDATQAAWREARKKGEYHVEHRVRRADGIHRWHQTRARPIDPGEPDCGEWVGTMTDIHELRELQDRQQVLLAELQHRTRNLLGVVQAVAGQTLRRSSTLEAFGSDFGGRLQALSRVQSLLASIDHGAVDLRALVEAELLAHGQEKMEAGRVTLGGPAVELPPGSAQAMALAVHELATNAVKHGALGREGGRLSVTWDLTEADAGPRLLLEWRETGVGLAAPPERTGYGVELIRHALPYQLNATTQLDFAADGVRCAIAVPAGMPGGGASQGEARHG